MCIALGLVIVAAVLLIARRSSLVAYRLSPVACRHIGHVGHVACRRARHQSSERECSPSSQLQVRSCARDFPLARSTKCAGSEREETFGVVHSFVPRRPPPSFFPNFLRSSPSFSFPLVILFSSLLFSSLLRTLCFLALRFAAPKFRPFRPLSSSPSPPLRLRSFALLCSNETSRLHRSINLLVEEKRRSLLLEISRSRQRERERPSRK